jgi:hypothetical protein
MLNVITMPHHQVESMDRQSVLGSTTLRLVNDPPQKPTTRLKMGTSKKVTSLALLMALIVQDFHGGLSIAHYHPTTLYVQREHDF